MNWAELFGRAIRETRESQHLTVEKTAKAMKVRCSLLENLERGTEKPSFDTIFKLAKTYKVEAGQFFLWSEHQTAEELRTMINGLLDKCSLGELKKIHRIALELRISEAEEKHDG